MRRKVGTGAALLLLAGLAGCSALPGSGQAIHLVQTYRGTAVAQRDASSSDDRPVVYWVTGRRDVALTAYGSSSCPPTPDSITTTSATRISVHLKTPGGPCTADLAATTSEFALPSTISRSKRVRVTLSEDGRTATPLTLEPDAVIAAHHS